MTDYAIGDLQGCLDELLRLEALIGFSPSRDRLFLVGDLVNRGPRSLDTLRHVRALDAAAVSVLGNHDLHLLACAHGRRPKRSDTINEILAAPDRRPLLEWLQSLPLAVALPGGGVMCHAGLPPPWTVGLALRCSDEVQERLRGELAPDFFETMYGDEPDQWSEQLRDEARLRYIVNALTRMRYCAPDGRLALREKGRPGHTTDGTLPWFECPDRAAAGERIVFGHWSTLGRVHWPDAGVWGLDTGCVWGGPLTALSLASGELFSVPSPGYQPPG